MKQALAFLLGFSMLFSASAQSGDAAHTKLAIISLIGDVMTIDTYRQRIGTGIDSNHQDLIPLSTPVFDHAALSAADDAIAKLIPNATVAPLAVPAPGSEFDPALWLVDDKVSASNALIAALRKEGFTQLLAITKHRAPARLQMSNGTVGNGYLKGLGFYIDNFFATKRSDTGRAAMGFIAPYVYIRLVLVDLTSLELRGNETITASAVQSTARNETAFDPWGAITPEEKVSMLKGLIRENVSEKVPLLFRSK